MAAVAIVDRHAIVVAGLGALLRAAGHDVIAATERLEELKAICTREPDVVVVGLDLATEEGTAAAQALKLIRERARLVLLLPESQVHRAADLEAIQADGVLLRNAAIGKLTECVRIVQEGGKWVDPDLLHYFVLSPASSGEVANLTTRENEVLTQACRGLRNKEIAQRLGSSEGTVKMHLHHIYSKLGISSRAQLVVTTLESRRRPAIQKATSPQVTGTPNSEEQVA